MMIALLLGLAATTGQAQKPFVIFAPSPPKPTPLPSPVPPTAEGPANSLRRSTYNPDVVIKDGKAYLPDVEVGNEECASPVQWSDKWFYTCKYNYRVKVYGQEGFGPWFRNIGKFALFDEQWIGIVDRKLCTGGDPKSQPVYCASRPVAVGNRR